MLQHNFSVVFVRRENNAELVGQVRSQLMSLSADMPQRSGLKIIARNGRPQPQTMSALITSLPLMAVATLGSLGSSRPLDRPQHTGAQFNLASSHPAEAVWKLFE